MSRLKLKVNNCLLNNKDFFKLYNSIFNKIGYNCFIIFQDYLDIKILKSYAIFESFEIYKIYKKNYEIFEILNFEKFQFDNLEYIFFNFVKF